MIERFRLQTFQEGNESLTYKKYNDDNSFFCKEIQMGVESADKMNELLKTFNIEEKFEIEKQRLVFKYHDVKIFVDRVKELGDFIEFKVKVQDESKSEDALSKIARAKEALSISTEADAKEGYIVMTMRNHGLCE